MRSGFWQLSFGALAAGDTVTAEVGGEAFSAVVPAITAAADADQDRLSGTAPVGMALVGCQAPTRGFTWRMECRPPQVTGGAYTVPFPAGQVDAAEQHVRLRPPNNQGRPLPLRETAFGHRQLGLE